MRKLSHSILAIILLALACTPLAADDGAIQAPDSASAGWPVSLSVAPDISGRCEWTSIPQAAARGIVPVEGGRRAVFACPNPGRYLLILAVDRNTVHSHAITLVSGGPAPDPTPDPIPPVPPPPVAKVATIMVVEESTQRTIDQVAVIRDWEWRDAAKAKSIRVREVEQNSQAPDVQPAIKAAQRMGLPAVVFLSAGGDVVAVEGLPNSAGLMLKRVEGLR